MKSIIITSAILFLIFFTLNETAGAQDCKEQAENMGLWVRNKDTRPIGQENAATVKYLKQITTVVDSIGALFINSYPIPYGSKVDWNRVLQSPDPVTMPDCQLASYLYSAYVLAYRCTNNKITVDEETPVSVVVSVNDYYRSGYQPCTSENKNLHENLFLLPPQQFTLGGYPGFASIADGWSDNITNMRYSVLVHKEGILPYTPVSIKEFFELCLKLIDFIEKKDLQEMMDLKKKGYTIDPDIIENIHQKSEKKRESVRSQMQRNAGKLDKPAVLIKPEFSIAYTDVDPDENLFTTPGRGYQLARPNPDYTNNNTEKWRPQYMWVSWTVNMNNSPYYGKLTAKLNKMMREEFDFGKLGMMLSN